MEKMRNYLSACDRLAFAVERAKQGALDDLERDGLVQRFEFTFELAWKSLKEYMEQQGVSDLRFPKQVLKEAYGAGIIDHDEIWIAMLYERNQSSHIFDEEVANQIAGQICRDFLPQLRALAEYYRSQENAREA